MSRFKPTRAGIINLWDYVEETFSFADGRLVLRGANGSGKTKALEVLFPFTLDGRIDARRLDPFSGENRTMRDNLLWRGVDAAYGYVWLEFTRLDDDDRVAERVTIGVGMRATRATDTPRRWFFVCDRTVGEDLHLVDGEGRPLTRNGLVEALGPEAVCERSGEYRARVDERLFGLGPERYESMLTLLLTLRRPMLAKDLDPRSLSDTLARGLRPLDDDLLEQAARSFDDLEAVQRELDRLVAADGVLDTFLTAYRGYVRAQARARVDRVASLQAELHTATASRDERQASLGDARGEVGRREAAANRAGEELETTRRRREGLKDSPAYRAAGQLTHLEGRVADAEAALARATAVSKRLTGEVAELAGHVAETEARAAEAEAEVAQTAVRVASSAAAGTVAWDAGDGDGAADDVRRRLVGRVVARRDDLAAVARRADAVADAERRADAGEAAVASAADELAGAEDAAVAAAGDVQHQRAALARHLAEWADGRPEGLLAAGDLDALAGALDALGDDHAASLEVVLTGRWASRRDEAVADRRNLADRLAANRSQRAALAARRQEILDERDDAPGAPPWRGADRRDRPGAPLWRLVRFADHVPTDHHGLLEAALEAAGLLDAWVHPSGEAEPGVLDAFLVADAPSGDGPTVADVLVPEDTDDVPVERVARLLRTIGLGAGVASVDVTGGYRLGPLVGAASAPARYIGATARAAHRQARIGALDAELGALDAEHVGLDAVHEELGLRLAAFDQALLELPSPAPLLVAVGAGREAAGAVRSANRTVVAARAERDRWRREVLDRRQALVREAAARSVPSEAGALAAVAAAVEQLAVDGDALVAALRRRHDATTTAGHWRAQLHGRREALAAAEAEHADRAVERDGHAAALAALRQALGADAAQVLDEVAAAEREITRLEALERHERKAWSQAAAGVARLEGEVATAEAAVATIGRNVEAAAARLRPLARADLADVLGVDPAVAVATRLPGTPVDALCEALDALTAGVSATEERLKAAQTRVSTGLDALETALGASFRTAWDLVEGDELVVVTVTDDEGTAPVASFAAKLASRRAEQESLLTDRERELFEDTLLASLCSQIHTRTVEARDLVAGMNAEMRRRRMSSGQTVGIAWRPVDADAERRALHGLLDLDPAHLGPDQLESLRRHFASEIQSARLSSPTTSYRELLGRVLDYRAWRRFELALVEADGGEAPLTRARHNRLSGGEKSASLHLPLFAAANATFAGARATCPRLIALDEAFAGIDDTGRPELLSLTVQFELDLFMTGYDLWATYASVPSAAHYDLLHVAEQHTVSTLLLLWDGNELVEGEDAERAVAAAPG